MSEAAAAPAPAPRLVALRPRRKLWLLAGAATVLAAIVAAGLRLLHGGPPLAHLTAKVQRGEIRDVVDATGTVNAVITVQVGSQVSGTIARLNADFNSRVQRGDVIALIDPKLFAGALEQADADLQNARANVSAAAANRVKAEATLVQTKADYDRAAALVEECARLAIEAGAELDRQVRAADAEPVAAGQLALGS